MKRTLMTIALCLLTASAWAQQSWSTNLTLNTVIPDNNPSGVAGTFAVGGLIDTISNVTVTLNITGGFNGDLYMYLVGPNGGFAVLLNRTGLSTVNAFGYANPGFNITLSDGAANGNIHYYQNVLNPGGAPLTGTWSPDGRNIDPQSAGSAFDAAAVTATLGSFIGNNANGTWGFFLADLSPGSQSTLVSVGLNILTVPEPQANALLALTALFGLWRLRHRSQRQTPH